MEKIVEEEFMGVVEVVVGVGLRRQTERETDGLLGGIVSPGMRGWCLYNSSGRLHPLFYDAAHSCLPLRPFITAWVGLLRRVLFGGKAPEFPLGTEKTLTPSHCLLKKTFEK
ncbi:hypothetical protein Pcinc_037919 [Petrolisthes cinctipes]|uniref:Uncharacterized protein n=1 Tax=Petrolisthes cinctipes TaxID=88211 RepID=A0AAE1BUT1_PETCI|nr:hypothetical protein Pcinc_037919 [Petrolisthes cinctipes]